MKTPGKSAMSRGSYSCLKLVCILSMLQLAGCASRVPFSKALIEEFSLSSSETQRLQFYISRGVLLEREQTSIDKNIDESYALKKVEDKYIKQIKFKRMTPCVVTSMNGNTLRVALEPKDNLMFQLDKSHRKGNIFVYAPDALLTMPEKRKRPRGAGYPGWTVMGTENYEDSSYDVLCRRTLPYLIVDQRSLRKLVIESRTAPGMKQGEIPQE